MSRLQALDPAQATGKTKTLLDGVAKKLGGVPNIVRTMATSPAVLEGYLGLSGALGAGRLPAKLREQLALAVVASRGAVDDAELERVRGAGFGDGEIAEIVAHVAQTEVDFPKAPALADEAA
jgi:alkylhydroperoxidase family enzyme